MGDNWRKIAVAVDFGPNATAFVVGRPYHVPPVVCHAAVTAFGPLPSAREASVAMTRLFRRLPRCGVYILEQQQLNNTYTPMMESALSALAATQPGALVVHVPPRRMTPAFGLPQGNHELRKQMATEVMWGLMADPAATLTSAKVVNYVNGLRRTHDVADAFLLFAWFARTGRLEVLRPPPGDPAAVVRATELKASTLRAEVRRQEKNDAKRKRAEAALVGGPLRKRRKLCS